MYKLIHICKVQGAGATVDYVLFHTHSFLFFLFIVPMFRQEQVAYQELINPFAYQGKSCLT